MTNKNTSILNVLLKTVSKLPWWKGASSSFKNKMKPGKGFNQPVSDHSFDYLKELNDKEFERLVSLIFKQRGYDISENHDQGQNDVDVVLRINNEITFVQYRHWREYHVDVAAIAELYNVMEAESAAHGIVMTTGIFTSEALDFALGKPLLLINGVDLSLMVGVLGSSSNMDNSNSETATELPHEEATQQMPELEPLCPICSQKMIKRTAKKGKNAGNTFWGCSQFPNCRGVVSS